MMSELLRSYGAIPCEVPTIAVEPPRTPAQMERAIKGLVDGRYAWTIFTSVNAVRAVWEKFAEHGLDARHFGGVKIACVGEATADAVRAFGIQPELVPSGEQSSEGLLAEFSPHDEVLDPVGRHPAAARRHRHRDAGRRPGRAGLGGRRRHRVPHRAGRAAAGRDPRRDQVGRVRRGAVHVVVDRAEPGRDRRQAARAHGGRGDRPEDGRDRRRVRPARRRPAAARLGAGPGRGARGVRRGAAGEAGGDAGQAAARIEGSGSDRAAVSARISSMSYPQVRPAAVASRRRRCAGWSPRPGSTRRSWCCRCSSGRGWPRPAADRVDAGRGAALPGLAAQGRRRGGARRRRRADALRRPVGAGRGRVGRRAIPDGILNVALRDVAAEVGDSTVIMSDLCLDEFTSHGHCGVLAPDGSVDNDATLAIYAEMAVAQARAGAHMVGLSGMMDGQVGAVRAALDARRLSRHLGPGVCREVCVRVLRAVPRRGRVGADRRPVHLPAGPGPNGREALREVALDVAEGADIVMVKPALPYLDVISVGAGRGRRAGRGVPDLRRVLDDRGGGGERLARPRSAASSRRSRRSAGPAPTSSSPTGRWRPPPLTRRDLDAGIKAELCGRRAQALEQFGDVGLVLAPLAVGLEAQVGVDLEHAAPSRGRARSAPRRASARRPAVRTACAP